MGKRTIASGMYNLKSCKGRQGYSTVVHKGTILLLMCVWWCYAWSVPCLLNGFHTPYMRMGIPLGFIYLNTQGYNGHGTITGVQYTVTCTKQLFTFTSILIQGKYRAFQVNNII